MSTLREAAQQVLEACTDAVMGWQSLAPLSVRSAAMESLDALRDALAQEEHPKLAPAPGWCKHCRQYTVEEPLLAQQEQEPVAWMTHGDNTLPLFHKTLAAALGWGACPTPLYAHPPQALTKEDIAQNLRSRHDAAKLLEERRQEITQPRRETQQEPAIYPDEAREMGLEEVALYTHPPRREWQSLSEEEIRAAYGKDLKYRDGDYERFARAIEAALKEKNA